ncbi:MAG: DUF4832 domain-containing protein, partial [Clostridia bacterium]|nr:DUF4832 domain-containing protein [Clostridia bacterium]
YVAAFPTTRLFTQVSRPHLVEYAKKYTNLGWRGDGLGEPSHTTDYYPPRIAKLSDEWKVAPVSFEAYWWLGEWKRQGWDIDEIIGKTLEWHISSFNPKSMPIPYEWQEKCEYWISRMGYHFAIDSISYPEVVSIGQAVPISLSVDNVGVAPSYKKMPLVLRLRCGECIADFPQSTDITAWLPGKKTEQLEINLSGANLLSGEYELEIGILSEHADVVYLATTAERDGGFYKVGSITVR